MAWLISELKWAKLWWEIQRKTRWNFLSNICFHVRSETSKNLEKKMSDFMEIETKIKSYCQSNFSFFYWFLFHNLSSDWMDLLLSFFSAKLTLNNESVGLSFLHETINCEQQMMLKSYNDIHGGFFVVILVSVTLWLDCNISIFCSLMHILTKVTVGNIRLVLSYFCQYVK